VKALFTFAVLAGSALARFVVGKPPKNDRAGTLLMPPPPRDSDGKRVFTSYSRHRGEYRYDIAIYETAPPADPGLFRAQVVNMVRLEGGDTVPIDLDLQDAYGATPDEAYSTLEAAVERWMKGQTLGPM
jgi:hypothetical protein